MDDVMDPRWAQCTVSPHVSLGIGHVISEPPKSTVTSASDDIQISQAVDVKGVVFISWQSRLTRYYTEMEVAGSLCAAVGLVALLKTRLAQRQREANIRVTQLHVHCVKGFRGHAVNTAFLDAQGLVWDRRWMVVRGEDLLFTTQRQMPPMATLEATVLLPQELAGLAMSPAAVVDSSVERITLRLKASKTGKTFDVPVITAADAGNTHVAGAKVVEHLTVWSKPVTGAVDQGDAVGAWLTDALRESPGALPPWNVPGEETTVPPLLPGAPAGSNENDAAVPLRLVYFDPDATSRPIASSRWPDDAPASLGTEVGFADGYPMLLCSSQSLGDLNARLPPGEGPLPMNRFRPNIVVDADAPWSEDAWRRFVIRPPPGGDRSRDPAGIPMWGVKRCARCKVPSIDQATGVAHPNVMKPEPLTTMRRFRGDAESSGEVYFGQNVIAEVPQRGSVRETRSLGAGAPHVTGSIAVGDRIVLLEVAPVPPL